MITRGKKKKAAGGSVLACVCYLPSAVCCFIPFLAFFPFPEPTLQPAHPDAQPAPLLIPIQHQTGLNPTFRVWGPLHPLPLAKSHGNRAGLQHPASAVRAPSLSGNHGSSGSRDTLPGCKTLDLSPKPPCLTMVQVAAAHRASLPSKMSQISMSGK